MAFVMLARPIPRTGEAIPVVGLGTWQTFDLRDGDAARAQLLEVLRRFFTAGGRVIDSSPMYGRAESVVGDLVAALGSPGPPFLATKVWTSGKQSGIDQMERSLARMRVPRLDLMQVHNLLDWRTHLPVLREWKAAGRIRYLGITHYARGAFAELEQVMRTEEVDFVQLPYNVGDRHAEARLLPAAAATGTAVLVMRPFGEGELLRQVRRRPLPAVARELACASWAELLLKFILAHPAVTCAIPATADPAHLVENLRAGQGPLPDEGQRRLIIDAFDA
jgi:aryl-alcohol dehydrogenase-like predicted oxidoreductase